jgi:peptidoglycan-associated lipoprotein
MNHVYIKLLLPFFVFISSCSSVSLDEQEDERYAAPIIKSTESKTLNHKEASSTISTKRLSPTRIENNIKFLTKQLGETEPSVYFDYDSFELKEKYITLVQKIGRIMRNNENFGIKLEGHSDERGTREYNIGLGNKRAETVAKLLQAEGISRDRIETISFGEERPVDIAQTESAWYKNRRCDLILSKRNIISE